MTANKKEQLTAIAKEISKYPAIIKQWGLCRYMDERDIISGCGCGCGGDQIGDYFTEMEQQGCDFQRYYQIILKLDEISNTFNIPTPKVIQAVEGIIKKYFLKE